MTASNHRSNPSSLRRLINFCLTIDKSSSSFSEDRPCYQSPWIRLLTGDPMKYSLQLYTLRDAFQEDLPGTIRRVADDRLHAGGALQLRGHGRGTRGRPEGERPDRPVRPRPAAQPGPGPRSSRRPRNWASPPSSTRSSRPSAGRRPRTSRPPRPKLNAAAKKGAEYGIRVGYHNHAWELESTVEGRTALEYFADLLDPELVLEVDTYWVAVGGQDPVAVLERLGRPGEVHPHQGRAADHGHQGAAAGRQGQGRRTGRHCGGHIPGSRRGGV